METRTRKREESKSLSIVYDDENIRPTGWFLFKNVFFRLLLRNRVSATADGRDIGRLVSFSFMEFWIELLQPFLYHFFVEKKSTTHFRNNVQSETDELITEFSYTEAVEF